MRHLNILLVIGLLAASVIFFSRCFHAGASPDPRGKAYAGAEACVSCHRDIATSYAHNNHYKTSSDIQYDSLRKMAAADRKRVYFMDSNYVAVEEKDHAFYQTLHGADSSVSQPFDIAFGSAEKAQTYGYWKGKSLYELPLTWLTGTHSWINSPGFTASHAHFGRIIPSRCFECHASYIYKETVPSGSLSVSEELDRGTIIYGIDCERCHGPAAKHVQFHNDHPAEKTARFITAIHSLSRQRQLDLCGMCHSGNDLTTQRTLFAFKPGDTLSHFFYPDFGLTAGNEPDVHGKQLQLLESSRCFKESNLTCTTCHNTHAPERNTMAAFIAVCMSCHQNSAHAAEMMTITEQVKKDSSAGGRNCIDCHMPLQTSKTIYFNNGAGMKNIPYQIRTHRIAVYQ